VFERSTYKSDTHVDSRADDDPVLRKNSSHAIVHDEETSLDKPYRQDLHLFNDQHKLRAKDTSVNITLAESGHICSRWKKVAVCMHD
jgi:hypothetical protein